MTTSTNTTVSAFSHPSNTPSVPAAGANPHVVAGTEFLKAIPPAIDTFAKYAAPERVWVAGCGIIGGFVAACAGAAATPWFQRIVLRKPSPASGS